MFPLRWSFFSVDNDLMLLEVSSVLLVDQNQVNCMLHTQSIVNVLVWRGQFNSWEIHSYWDDFSTSWATIHCLELDQCLLFGFWSLTRTKCLSSLDTDVHRFDFKLDQLEGYLTHQTIFQMVVRFFIKELNMETLLNTDLHLDWDLTLVLKFWSWELDRKV